jgi:SpoVK/Ycf46/Vps4 family AAA+-type ATPase
MNNFHGTGQIRMPARLAQTRNMQLALDTMFAIITAPFGVPRMATFSGPSGWGKTVACSHVAAVTDAIYIEVRSTWTTKTFLEELARELGISHRARTAADIQKQICERLSKSPCPLIIDEMDYLASERPIGAVRDIYESTAIPILMVGEENLPAKLKTWERFDNRILKSTLAEPANIADGRMLRDLYAGKVSIADDLIDHFVRSCHGVTRRIMANLQEASRVAVDELEGGTAIDLAAWGNRQVMNGDLPRRARLDWNA